MKKISRRDLIKFALSLPIIKLISFENILASDKTPDISIPVLLYHEITYEPLTDYTVTPENFWCQMEYLYSTGFKSILPKEFMKHYVSGDKFFIITFDDGSYTFLEYALPVLELYKFKAIMNIIGNRVGKGFDLSWDEYKYMLSKDLIEIGCHGYDSHIFGWSKKLSIKEFERDLRKFQEICFEKTGIKTELFASPYGEQLTKEHLSILKKLDFKYIQTSERKPYKPYIEKEIIPRFNINHELSLNDFKNLIKRSTS